MQRESGAPSTPDNEITPEMIEAGTEALYESGAIEHPLVGADRELVVSIYLAMCRSQSLAIIHRSSPTSSP